MNPQRVARAVEFALRKQRLQLRAEQQRAQMLQGLERIESVLDVADRVREGVRDLGRQAPLLSAGALLLVVLKPRFALRLAKRVWVGWAVYRRFGRGVEPLLGILRRFVA
ncbi:MAG TPA: YqjK-like family protein [Aromatoleum sp.]|uniref:YqjK-like family protein n=1 Tax=Aromatoleum sp. TaxID=2307007 RepID=UPI002B475761|nr:YqjK-like family protein [Aromatoleum sp.]HJV24889.1 YqjK-like family protein [Aromatoleum sp.]